jgi:ABC-2 type transport system permease protein
MNIVRRELKRNWKAWLIWSASIALLIFYVLSFFPAIARDGDKWTELFSQMPPEFSAAFNLDQLRMDDLLGWFGAEGHLMLTLFGSVYVAMLGAGIVSKEEGEHTIEFLLAKPVSRAQIITQKLLAGAILVTGLNVVACAVSFLGFELYQQGPYDHVVALHLFLACLIQHLLFYCAGILLSLLLPKARGTTPAAVGLVLATFFLDMIGELSERAGWLRHLSPFRYADAAEIVANGGVEGGYTALALGLITLFVGLSYYFYQRKDITA